MIALIKMRRESHEIREMKHFIDFLNFEHSLNSIKTLFNEKSLRIKIIRQLKFPLIHIYD